MGFLDRFRSSGLDPDDVLQKTLLVPTPDIREPATVAPSGEDREISVLLVQDEDGLSVLPAFTSEQALARWRPQGSAYVALPGGALVEMLAGSDWDRMVVDGADPTAFALTRSDAGRLVGAAALSVGAGSAYRIGQPAQPPPDGLVEALQSACEREPEVLEAYLYQFQIVERDEPPHLALGARLSPSVDEPEVRRIAQSIVGLVEPVQWGYEFLDFHPLDGELLEAARANGTALLQRD